MIHISSVISEIHSLRSLARCLTDTLDMPISFKHLQRITRDLGVRCKRPKLELLHGKDYEEGKKGVMLVFEDETTITQKPCIRRSMGFEGQQQRIEHNGSRNKFSTYISKL